MTDNNGLPCWEWVQCLYRLQSWRWHWQMPLDQNWQILSDRHWQNVSVKPCNKIFCWLKLGFGLFDWFLVEPDLLVSSFIKFKILLSKTLKSYLTLTNDLVCSHCDYLRRLKRLALKRIVNQSVTVYHFIIKWARSVECYT